MKTIIYFLSAGPIVYCVALAYLYFTQTAAVFPANSMNSVRPVAPIEGEITISLTANDGTKLAGRMFKPNNWDGDTIIAFHGNAHNPIGYVRFLNNTFPTKQTVAFFYRSYGESEGIPSKNLVLSDALSIFDKIVTDHKPKQVFLSGVSLGSSVASYVASNRKVNGLFLITPIDSVLNLAKAKYPYFPIKYLLRENFDNISSLKSVEVPTVLIQGRDDNTVPQKPHGLLVQNTIKNLVHHHIEPNVEHGELLDLPEMSPVMQKGFEKINN